MQETIKLKGTLEVTLVGPSNEVKQQFTINNLITTVGLGLVASRMAGNALVAPSHMAVGSGATAAVVGNTALQVETGRVALDSATAAGSIVTYDAEFGAGIATGSVSEAGLLNASSSGILFNRATFPTVNKDAADTLRIVWAVEFI